MVLTEGLKGSLLMDGTVQNIIPTVTGLKYYSGYIFTHNLVTGDSITFTIYVNDPQSSTERIYDQFTVSGAQTKPATFLVNVPTDSYRVTAEQTTSGAGGFKTLTFVRYDS